MKVVLDTNFLMAQTQFKADIFGQLKGDEVYTISPCVKELQELGASMKKDAYAARVALELLKKKNIKIILTDKNADAALLAQGKKVYAIATNDKNLIQRLKEYGIKVLRLKQKKHIILLL